LRFEDIPEPVVRKIEDLLVDWFASAVAGHAPGADLRPFCTGVLETVQGFCCLMPPRVLELAETEAWPNNV
jgi:hypothetical protein